MIPSNPVPTSGDVRVARARAAGLLRPVLRYLRTGVFIGLGLCLAGLGRRASTPLALTSGRAGDPEPAPGLAERGAATVYAFGSRQAVRRATDHVAEVTSDLASKAETLATKAEVAVDEAHDLVEEVYGRAYLWRTRLRRTLTSPRDGKVDDKVRADR